MLTLKNIVKDYLAGDTVVPVLKGIDIEFRKNEFVAVLGPSGCGKTTLLNIIGGLDGYTSGDLIIGGRSTKEFNSADWDSYRNHSVGFVFQSYNLIPHQTVLSNVELALTLSGVSRSERRRRAEEALKKVGLGDQLKKKPNQMSGGQVQRVAIARALVNDPEILLADEPTGALDTETSVQIMDILREISKDKLIIMVTHNPELASKYATRTVKLLDGKIIEDTKPYHGETVEILSRAEQKKRRKKEKTSMSFFTALSLSLNNLMTKKARTILTGFAGSIGIIGIALILSVSSGVQSYINRVQEDMLSSYPITIAAESVDMNELVSAITEAGKGGETPTHELDRVYASAVMYDLVNKLNSIETSRNNLGLFKKFLESGERFDEYVSAVQYSYDLGTGIYVRDADGKVIKSDAGELMASFYGFDSSAAMANSPMSQMSYMSSMKTWEELLPGENGELVNSLLDEQYDVVYGKWPENYDEAVLVVDKNNEITDLTLYALGIKSEKEMKDAMAKAMRGEQIDTTDMGSWSYEDICGIDIKVIPASLMFVKQENDTYADLSSGETGLSYLYDSDKAINLHIVGIIRESENAVASMLQGSLAYTHGLTDKLIEIAEENEAVKAQLADKSTDVISGLPFKTDENSDPTDAEKAEMFREYADAVTDAEKAEFYKAAMSTPSDEYLQNAVNTALAGISKEDYAEMLSEAFAAQTGADVSSVRDYIDGLSDEEKHGYITDIVKAKVVSEYAGQVMTGLSRYSDAELAAMFDSEDFDLAALAVLYDNYMPNTFSDSTYGETLKKLGYVDKSEPSAINIFARTFEDKDEIASLITEYNKNASEEDEISYTDYVALLMSSITTIISAISYVLIAFVAISLVVSSVMIGIITYISVIERTKEIGILRAIGASKRDVSRVFNAETLIVGFVSGALGIGITLLLNIVINIILHSLTGIPTLNAILPWQGAVILVLISMLLTYIAGLIPSGIAARKNPVIALRSE